jgi:hypothetical protein
MSSTSNSFASHPSPRRPPMNGLAVNLTRTRLPKHTASVFSICAWALGLSVSICLLGQYHLHPSTPSAASTRRTHAASEQAGRSLQQSSLLRIHRSASNEESDTSKDHTDAQANVTKDVTSLEKLDAATSPIFEQSSVGVVVTITGCSNFPPDGAAVLQYSVLRQQREERPNSPYRYQFYAIYHPSARACAEPLADLNFTLMERESPVLPHEIKGRALRDVIATSGTSSSLFTGWFCVFVD